MKLLVEIPNGVKKCWEIFTPIKDGITEVTECTNCKWCSRKILAGSKCVCDMHGMIVDPTGWCWLGERR